MLLHYECHAIFDLYGKSGLEELSKKPIRLDSNKLPIFKDSILRKKLNEPYSDSRLLQRQLSLRQIQNPKIETFVYQPNYTNRLKGKFVPNGRINLKI